MDNYICVDGVKVLLNDSQISDLRAVLEKRETKRILFLNVRDMVMSITISILLEK